MSAIFRVIAWSLGVLARGVWPTASHTNVPWGEDYPRRLEKAGQKIKFAAACLFVKGDWSEFVTSLGFPAWSDGVRPCFCCNSFDDLFEHDDCDPLALRWRDNSESDYFQSCSDCEVCVVLDRPAHHDILTHLKFDKRKTGSKGRALMVDVVALGLRAGDRLEVGGDVSDIGSFDNISTYPIRCVFWRPGNESMTRHRNPIFDDCLGINPHKSLALDTLHAVNLGVMLVYCRIVVWYLLGSVMFAGPGNADESLHVAVMAFALELNVFYKARAVSHPTEVLTRVSDFSVKLIGTKESPKLKTKGAETFGILVFVLSVLDRHKDDMFECWEGVVWTLRSSRANY